MNDMVTPSLAEDAAWAAVNTPLSVEDLRLFCQDIERLYRINPLLEFHRFETIGNQRYAVKTRNLSQQPPFELECTFAVTQLPDGVEVSYDRGIKSSTTFKVEAAPQGSRLTITDRYERLPPDERKQHLLEVDKSLLAWTEYLQRFIITWKRWSGMAFWRWYMRRVWQPMKPAARRITYMLLWITAVEIALIALGVTIYFIEYR